MRLLDNCQSNTLDSVSTMNAVSLGPYFRSWGTQSFFTVGLRLTYLGAILSDYCSPPPALVILTFLRYHGFKPCKYRNFNNASGKGWDHVEDANGLWLASEIRARSTTTIPRDLTMLGFSNSSENSNNKSWDSGEYSFLLRQCTFLLWKAKW